MFARFRLLNKPKLIGFVVCFLLTVINSSPVVVNMR